MFIGGGMANTFLLAEGHQLGKSLVEKDYIQEAKKILKKANVLGKKIYLPIDAVVAKEFKQSPETEIKAIDRVGADEMILDIGIKTTQYWLSDLEKFKTVFW
ncbi:MAG: phosphoglycerate kinase, partial [Pirellulaceae bacterium]